MTLKTAIPELKRISKEVFNEELSCRNVREVIRIYKLEKLKIKIT